MKKEYVKPVVVFESFSLSTNIAAGCESIVGNPSKDSCPVAGTGGIAIFNTPENGCEFTPAQMGGVDDMWDGFCYHVPTETNNLFNS